MGKVEVKVKFETITPLWTGDTWGENQEIKPSAILGSLRFWFEVICYFSGIVNEIDFDKNKGRFEKEVKQNEFRDFFKTHGSTFKCKIDALLKQGIPVSAIVFGTTGWGSLIKIKEINYLENYSFGNSLNLPRRICISKNNSEVKEGKECPKKSNEDWSVFYFGIPYFWGSFQANFTVEEEILESIFYPLLAFMDRYGYWGGKWNMGYGRLKVSEIQRDNKTIDNWKRGELKFNFSLFSKKEKKEKEFIQIVEEFSDLIAYPDDSKKNIKLLLISNKSASSDLKEIIKDLIKKKIIERREHKRGNRNNTEERHKIWGTTKPPPTDKNKQPQGSKILPYIDEEQKFIGFLSLTDLLKLPWG